MEACRNCKHWEKETEEGSCGYGICQKIESAYELKIQLPVDEAFALIESEAISNLLTSPDFGCRLFEAKDCYVADSYSQPIADEVVRLRAELSRIAGQEHDITIIDLQREVLELKSTLASLHRDIPWVFVGRPPEVSGEKFLAEHEQLQFDNQELTAEVEALNTAVFVPGDWVCPKCSFTCHERTLNAFTGEIGINTTSSLRQTECPNDGETLEQLTWKADDEKANQIALDLMKELRACRERLSQLDEPVN